MSKNGGLLFLCVLFSYCQRNPYSQGELIYDTFCANCHMSDGLGMGALYPAILDSDYLVSRSSELPCLIRRGQKSDQLATVAMPAQKEMTEASMTNLINYINYRWGNQKAITMSTIQEQLSNCSEE